MRRPAISISFLLCLFVLSTPLVADAGADLHDLFAREWSHRQETNPFLATRTGRSDLNDRLPDIGPEAIERNRAATETFLAELDAIDADELDDVDRVNAAIFRRQLESRLDDWRFGAHEIPINADSGFHIGFARLPSYQPLATTADYEAYVARLDAWPAYVDQQIAHMRRGLERGMTLPRVVLEGYEGSIESHVVDDPTESLFFAPFERFPVGVPEADRAGLVAEGRRAITEAIVPGYRAFLDFMVDEYMPGARTTLGASELPDGEAYYDFRVHYYTTLDMTPKEIHELGKQEVARIRAEMDAIIEEVGFEGDFAAFLEFLRTDPRFYPETPEELLKEAAWYAKQMDGKLPALFKTLPRQPYGIEPVPAHIAPKYTAGRYSGSPLDSKRGGYYWVNTYDLPSRTLYTLEALTYHEATPGHHLQNALNQEQGELPPFRQFSYISAFGEGWGLYSEWLGLELGFYSDPYSNFGRLTYEMWRACRLVVDTGVHAFGWTRDQVMDYLASNTALSIHEVTTETDRYISWPAQALSYKIGELTIKRLRREAEEALGERFDVREFHDVVLGRGSVPLPVLEDGVRAWVEASLEP